MNHSEQREVLAFHLPQFHRVKENDEWWGEGFTDWRNAKKSTPRFKGHWQPHQPGELGEYDLAKPGVLPAQWELATQYGITGFCFYHYWFHGRRILETPVNRLIADNSAGVRFCLCWANESWTRSWDGQEQRVLMKQEYSEQDHAEHIAWLLTAMKTPGYIQIDGSPVMLVYRPDKLLESGFDPQQWRDAARAAGFNDLFLIGVASGLVQLPETEILKGGFDRVVEFSPNRADFGSVGGVGGQLGKIAENLLPSYLYHWLKQHGRGEKLVDYNTVRRQYMARLASLNQLGERVIPCCFPSWDNSPRRSTPTIIQNLDDQAFGTWVQECIRHQIAHKATPALTFINAWNEWGEGCHLEPDARYERARLTALKAALDSV